MLYIIVTFLPFDNLDGGNDVINCKIFGGRVRLLIPDRSWGDFNPNSQQGSAAIQTALRELRADDCISPKLACTNKVATEKWSYSRPFTSFWKTEAEADAIITQWPSRAIMINTADCWSGVLYSPDPYALCLVHLGIHNLYRKDGSPTTLAAAVQAMRGPPISAKELLFWFGGGIHRCCYGYDEGEFLDNLRKRYGPMAAVGLAVNGPSAGKIAVSLNFTIWQEAGRLGLQVEQTLESDICTSCDGLHNPAAVEFGNYWSHIRSIALGTKEPRPRNGVFAIMA